MIKPNKLDVWLLELAQINRAGKFRPTLENLKDSGQIEQDADCVLFLHSDFYANDEDEQYDRDMVEISIAKYRQFSFKSTPIWEMRRSNFNKFADIGRKEVPEVGAFFDDYDDLPY